ncbi:serine/threonine protein kinase [Actinomycetospora lemnae]|uniref:Protein kinase n=1 Tax=Actinomycetospora lemnae TaxID=3019891 RepID=A0ABT5SV35_9PSEU|nr:protein kinase [Actinomycetospora sp. DW7H6]MDD7966561.1 protein kinase [Actinomycetospora sp. DW7H6]
MSETLEPPPSDSDDVVGSVGDLISLRDDQDEYQILAVPVRGGEGWTYQAQSRGGSLRAIKQLRRPVGAGPEWPPHAEVRRWHDVVEPLQTEKSPHLVRVIGVFAGPPPCAPNTRPASSARCVYVVMEWVEGSTLDDSVREGRQPLRHLVRAVRDLGEAVRVLHSETRMDGSPTLHLDIKPANCIVTRERGLVLVDTGTMRRAGEDADPRRPHTPGFVAPEYIDDPARRPTTHADVYALGAVLYFCLTRGEVPPATGVDGASAELRGVLRPAARRLAVPLRTLVPLVVGPLHPDPAHRPADVATWMHDLERVIAARPVTAAVTTAVVVVTAAVVGLGALAPSDAPPESAGAASFVPFGQTYAPFDAKQSVDVLRIVPPSGPERFEHLWGMHATGPPVCSSHVEFDVTLGDEDRSNGFGVAVAPRSEIRGDQPAGSSVQYEWVPASVPGGPNSRVRPASLPGGAWNGRTARVDAPDVGTRRHISVDAVGTSMSVALDGGTPATFATETEECGVAAIRVWGTAALIENVRVGPAQ